MGQFLSLDALKTYAGAIAAVVALVQIVKQLVPKAVPDDTADVIKRWLAVMAGVGLQTFLVDKGASTGAYVLAVVNGLGVALAAMKLYEMSPAIGPTPAIKGIAAFLVFGLALSSAACVENRVDNRSGTGDNSTGAATGTGTGGAGGAGGTNNPSPTGTPALMKTPAAAATGLIGSTDVGK